MRVLYLTEEAISFSDAMVRGGAIHVRNVVTGLRDRGHDVTLLDWNDAPERPFQLSVSPRTRFVDGPLRTLGHAVRIGDRRNVDVIVSKTRKTYLPGLFAARRLGVPHVVHVGSSLDPPVEGLRGRLDLASFGARLRAPHDGYLVVCAHIGDQLRERGVAPDRIFDVRNAVDVDRFHPDRVPTPLADRFRDQLPADDGLVVGFVGGLQPYKGLDDLADALERTERDWHLLVAGDGPDRDRLEGRFGQQATFLGSVPYEQIPALYHEFDAFALPSHTEGLPRVVLEAQATATPVVATRVGGVPEVIEDGGTGLLCDPHQPADLADALDRLTPDAGERDRLGRQGRAAVETEFSWPALYERYERDLRQVIE
ncbi:glycosyltransferase family 4 protein [Halorientalis regularis]|uniref:Glycosyltransferase involved in cell wall bisynthesis n=1 Tax=Halorientalis regularis TaxID=660518 RepID=A0A1G7FYM7_9EURY|nr:glycosyltransferase family 4 protein [Halorientalis regularis]SDE80996.1 Glycosyltransferase involved in cell wall bisynthesis [Halorientalis regularis]